MLPVELTGRYNDSPTDMTYHRLNWVYDHLNEVLFDGRLPRCLITLQRHKGAYGFFHGERFTSRDGGDVTDEIALNPATFVTRTARDIVATLVHEMCHLEQHHFGKPSRTAYHNKEWAGMMRAVGLIPSDTGRPGGKEVGQKVHHYIEEGGRFDRAWAALPEFDIHYIERPGGEEERAKKRASKTKFTCPDCGTNAWGKPELYVVCGDCEVRMEPQE